MPINVAYLQALLDELAAFDAKLIAVSKTKPVSTIRELIELGQFRFGENRVQELAGKHDELISDSRIEWHMIGHLQRNKIKYISRFVDTIHSVDSMKLLHAIDAEAGKAGRQINCLLQVHIAEETSKFGFSTEELNGISEGNQLLALKNVKICGLMGMATFCEDESQITREFSHLRKLYEQMSKGVFSDFPDFKEISMGMSGDYKIALNCGSTMVRIGSAIFGHRD